MKVEEKDLELLEKDLNAIVEKWGLVNCSFCGTDEENSFIGIPIGNISIMSVWEMTLNVGRFWQHARERIHGLLGDFEIKRGW
jgi:hypothetical protein